jgi:hypothetical protein
MPSLGIIIGLPIAGILLIALAIAFFAFGRYAKTCDQFDRGPALGIKWGSLAVAVVVVAIAAVAFWPYRWEYHSWQTTSGTVQAVSKRLVSTGDKGMEERFVVAFTDGRQRACDDTRCSLLKPGMTLTLRCKRAYQWGATPGYDCNYVEARS